MSLKLPRVIGHRGACAYAPENTLISLHTAADMGCKWVEVDVKLSKDFVPILMHDDTLDRTTGIQGAVKDYDFHELRDMDAGQWFGDSFINTKIPSLEEVMELILQRNLGINLEIKPCPGRERDTAEAIFDLLTQIWDDDDRDRVLITSFSYIALETAMDIAPDWARGLLIDDDPDPNWADMAKYFAAQTIHFSAETATREFVEELMDFQSPLYAYTVNDPRTAQTFRQWGVDGFFTNTPDIIHDGLFKAN